MPFELGLACSLKLEHPSEYDVIVFESKRFRADRSLSDYKGHDVAIHGGTCDGILAAVLETFHSEVSVTLLRRMARDLRRSAEVMKSDLRSKTLFHPHLFLRLLSVAADMAHDFGLALP